MPYARVYDKSEVKGMLMIAEGSANITSFNAFAAKQAAKGKTADWKKAPAAHAGVFHAGATPGDMTARVAGGGPETTSSFKNFEMMVDAVTEGLNHATGQAALALLDGGAADATFNAPLGANLYYGSRTSWYGLADQNKTKKQKVKQANVTDDPFLIADQVFVKISRFVGGRLWIQTAYPARFNMVPVAATLAALP